MKLHSIDTFLLVDDITEAEGFPEISSEGKFGPDNTTNLLFGKTSRITSLISLFVFLSSFITNNKK